MIVSASRRTDIPALYSRWFAQRLREGFCLVQNPRNARQIARVSLAPGDVVAFVFWTRHAAPFAGVLDELDRHGFHYYFQYTITGYGRPLEARAPPLDRAIATFSALASRLRPGAVVWRYDPILLGPAFPVREHLARFKAIAARLEGHTRRVVTSFLCAYKRTVRRVGEVVAWERDVDRESRDNPELESLLSGLATTAREHGMALTACSETIDLERFGIGRAKCIDDGLLGELFGGEWPARKDPGQRPACRCVVSKDIGAPDSCTFGCTYCYATRSDALARRRFREHDPNAPALCGKSG